MTEITGIRSTMAPAVERFVLKWGDMGGEWGVNRSVAQIHALLYVTAEPLTAEDIAETLGIARSNVSNSLKELLAWNLIRRVPQRGDRRDFFEAEGDIWEIVQRIAIVRKAREIDPAMATLKACLREAEGDARVGAVARQRLKDMLEFTDATDRWFGQMLALPRPQLKALLKLGGRIAKFLPRRARAKE